MHGGIYGLLESAMRGIPVITIPIFGDQHRNGKIAESRGWGINIHRAELSGETLKNAIVKIFNDSR
jgi:UDP:flavonoid glycosyltransferase YjiC (YdhE family)